MGIAQVFKDVKEKLFGPTPPTDEELTKIVRMVFNKHSLYDDRASDFNMTIRGLKLWLQDFANPDETKALGKELVDLLTGLHNGSIRVSKSRVERLIHLIDTCEKSMKLNLSWHQFINRAMADEVTGDDLDRLSDLFARNIYLPDVSDQEPRCKWMAHAEKSRHVNLDDLDDPGSVIYKIVESYRYFDIIKASEIFAGVRPLSPTVKAVCLYELCANRFKVDVRVSGLIKNDVATQLALGRNTVGFYCCDTHAMADREVGRRELIALCLKANAAWKNKVVKTVDMDRNPRWCIPWRGQLVRASSFVIPLVDFTTDKSINDLTLWWKERFSPFWTLPKYRGVANDLLVLTNDLRSLFPSGNY